jgi:hypothetical protein
MVDYRRDRFDRDDAGQRRFGDARAARFGRATSVRRFVSTGNAEHTDARSDCRAPPAHRPTSRIF